MEIVRAGIGSALVERMHEELRRMDVSRFFIAVNAGRVHGASAP